MIQPITCYFLFTRPAISSPAGTPHPDEVLVEHGPVGLMELLLNRASRANFLLWMQEHKALARSLPAVRYLRQGIDYVFEVGQGKAEEIIDTLKKRRYADQELGDSQEHAFRSSSRHGCRSKGHRPF